MIKAYFMKFDVDGERNLEVDEDVIVRSHVTSKLVNNEADLYTTKWFDYRRMTPLQATLEYVKEYKKAYRDTYKREIDYERAEHVRVIGAVEMLAALHRGDTKFKSKLSSYWRGRQVADALGMPYDLYISWAFEFRMRRWKQPYLPQPQHLYHEYDVEKIQERWEEHQASIFFRPKDPAFLVQNYQDIPYQNDFHEWLFKQAFLRSDPYWSLAFYIEEHLMPIDKVEARLGDDFERVERHL